MARLPRGLPLGALWLLTPLLWTSFVPEASASHQDRPQCLSDLRGLVNRSHTEVTLSWQTWGSHNLVTSAADIILRELLGYTVHLYGGASDSYFIWGEPMTNGMFDIDLEQWEAQPSGQQYEQYITARNEIVDAGSIGYTGRSGLYTFRSVLQNHRLADYYKFYQNATEALQAGFPSFASSQLTAFLGESFPVCGSQADPVSWCGTGQLEGSWAPPQCENDPSSCVEILKPFATYDPGRFEQMVKNNDINAVFTYYGMQVQDLIRSKRGQPLLFYWWKPSALLYQLDAVRISFPDFVLGCDNDNTRDPRTGETRCDLPETVLRKIVASRVRDTAIEAFEFVERFEISSQQMEAMLNATEGNASVFDVACDYVRQNLWTLTSLMGCIPDPEIEFRDGVWELINPSRQSCIDNSAFFPQAEPTVCAGLSGIGNVSRDRYITIVRRGWLSHDIISEVTEVLLRDFLGFHVRSIVNTRTQTERWGPEIEAGLYDIDMENWQVQVGTVPYIQYVDSGVVFVAGDVGFSGRSGLYLPKWALERNRMLDYYKSYQNASAIAADLVLHDSSALRQVLGADFPTCTVLDTEWCGVGTLEGYWSSPQCEGNPRGCIEIIHRSPGRWDTGYLEQLAKNLHLEVVVAYYGNRMWDIMIQNEEIGKASPFYWWEPDPYNYVLPAVRVSFPDYYVGCDTGNTQNPNTGTVTCDFRGIRPAKISSARVRWHMKEAFYVLQRIQMLSSDLDALLPQTYDAGGNKSASELACEFLSRHASRIREWAPDCLVRPRSPEDVRINHSVFSYDFEQCMPMTCPSSHIIVYSGVWRNFDCQPCDAEKVPAPHQRECILCAPGEMVHEDHTRCVACPAGQFSLGRSGSCSECAPGTYTDGEGHAECKPCFAGMFQSLHGQTSCLHCAAGHFASASGSQECQQCSPGFYSDNSSTLISCEWCASGKFSDVYASTSCQVCPYGTTPILGARSVDQCGCPETTFLSLDSGTGNHQCTSCNEYMEHCEGGSAPPYQKAGFHVSTDGNTLSVVRCASEVACPAGPLGSCKAGSQGRGCADCEDNYIWNGKHCVECTSVDAILAFILPLVIIAAVAFMYKFGNDPVGRRFSVTSEFIVLVGLSMNVFLYLGSVSAFNVDWKEPLKGLLAAIQVVTKELTRIRLFCSVSFGHVSDYAFASLAPLVVALVLIVLSVLRLASPQALFNTFGTITYALFLLLVLHGLKPFRYVVHPNGSKSLLDLPSVFEGSAEHSALMVCGVSVLVCYCLPFATVATYAVLSIRRAGKQHAKRRWYLVTFRFLFFKFHPEAYYWGLCILLRNAIFALAPSLYPEYPILGIFLLSLAASLSAVHTSHQWPWRCSWMNFVDVGISCYLVLMLIVAAVWARSNPDVVSVLATCLLVLGVAAGFAAAVFCLKLLVGIACASNSAREEMRIAALRAEEHLQRQMSKYFDEEHHELEVAVEQLLEVHESVLKIAADEVPSPLLAIVTNDTTLASIAAIASSIREPSYTLHHFHDDCLQTFPELFLYAPGDGRKLLDQRNAGGHSGMEEMQRTMGALFAVYCLCRLDMDGKALMSFGVDPNASGNKNIPAGPPSTMQQSDLEGIVWGKMTPLQRRANFYWNFDWGLLENLFFEAGILVIDDAGRRVAAHPEGPLVAMLSLTAYHDIMKDQALCPTVHGESYQGYKAGEKIQDHDMALAYILDRHPHILPSFRILTREQQRLVRFTQSEMGFNAGWLVQAEGPPSAVLKKLKKAIDLDGAKDCDVAFYFVHWVTDLAGAEPTPFNGSEKYAVKFPPAVLQGLLSCFSMVRMLADHTETQVYEAYLKKRWEDIMGSETAKTFSSGEERIAKMRILCMAQQGAKPMLHAFDLLDENDRATLLSELSETGLPGQEYSAVAPDRSHRIGTPFLLYYGPAWCQRAGASQPDLALRVLARVLRVARDAYPESLDVQQDHKDDITCRTIQVGVLKTINMEVLRQFDAEDDNSVFAVQRDTRLEGTLELVYVDA